MSGQKLPAPIWGSHKIMWESGRGAGRLSQGGGNDDADPLHVAGCGGGG